jgi:hypothetical protein
MYILPPGKELRVYESSEFKVVVVIRPEEMSGNGNEDDLPGLPQPSEVSQSWVSHWAANGNTGSSEFGTIIPDGAHCNYTAPATEPDDSRNPVQLSANLANLIYRNPVTGRDMTSLILVAPVEIKDDNFAFRLNLKFKFDSYANALAVWTLTDNATIEFEVRNGFVTVTDTINEDGSVTPASQSIPYGDGECISTWINEEGAKGYWNVTSVSGETGPYGFDDKVRSLILTVTHSKTRVPKFRLVCPDNDPTFFGGEVWETIEKTYSFVLYDSTQTYPSRDPYETVTLEPK